MSLGRPVRISKLCGAAPQAPVSLIVLLMCADYQLVDFWGGEKAGNHRRFFCRDVSSCGERLDFTPEIYSGADWELVAIV